MFISISLTPQILNTVSGYLLPVSMAKPNTRLIKSLINISFGQITFFFFFALEPVLAIPTVKGNEFFEHLNGVKKQEK